MVGPTTLKKSVTIALAQAKKLGATSCEVLISNGTEEVTRFANSMIHQSVFLNDSLVHVRVCIGQKIGVARTNRIDKEGISDVVIRAVEIAKLQRADPFFVGLPEKSSYKKTETYYAKTKHVGPVGRANAVGIVINEAKKASLVASGAFTESENEVAIANSNGVWGYQMGKSASLSTIMMGDKGSGYGAQSAKGGSEINPRKVGKTAVAKATLGELIDVPAGEYEVILEPPAVAELLDFFAWLGANARIYHEGVSFYQGNLGKQFFHESLTIADDPYHPLGYPVAFDYEGFPKKRHLLVDKGVLTGLTYDSYHANKHKKQNTGHGLLAPNTWGPIPTHMVIEPGDSTVPDMIKNVKKGLLVTRFWYTRVIHHKQLLLTGMTRDGTFYIENGKIVGRARNLRYTESVLTAFKNIKSIGKTAVLEGSEGSPSVVPALHIGKFRFTSTTKHG